MISLKVWKIFNQFLRKYVETWLQKYLQLAPNLFFWLQIFGLK